MRVSQGSTLSTSLFNTYINCLIEVAQEKALQTDNALFAEVMGVLENGIQRFLNLGDDWASLNGLK